MNQAVSHSYNYPELSNCVYYDAVTSLIARCITWSIACASRMWNRRDINKYMRKLEADKDAEKWQCERLTMEPEVEQGKAELAAFCARPETLQPVDDINIRLLVHLQMADTPLQMTDIEVMLHVSEFL